MVRLSLNWIQIGLEIGFGLAGFKLTLYTQVLNGQQFKLD